MQVFLVQRLFIDTIKYPIKGRSISYNGESVFSSFSRAREHLDCIRIRDAEDYDADMRNLFQYVIIELCLDKGEVSADSFGAFHYWRFNQGGELKAEFSIEEGVIEEDPDTTYQGLYEKGEIVYVLGMNVVPGSPSVSGDYAVIGNTPNEHLDPEGHYLAYFIDAFGELNHYHIPEKYIAKLDKELPSEFEFLRVASGLYRGTLDLPTDLIDRIWDGKVFVAKKEVFDWGTLRNIEL